jgi:hypothetical protein
MTAIAADGYGVIYLTPNQLVDFSVGEATVAFDVSTLRLSHRDWIDLWITPYADILQPPPKTGYPTLTVSHGMPFAFVWTTSTVELCSRPGSSAIFRAKRLMTTGGRATRAC